MVPFEQCKQSGQMNNPGILNDVIGPVMRGPSSSHTAASWRIARVCLDIFNEPLKKAVIAFDKNGAWAANHREQGTALGIDSGLLGLDITDDRVRQAGKLATDRGIEIKYEIAAFPTKHTNTVRLTLKGTLGKKMRFLAVSTGGGAFEIQQIDQFEVSIRGDYYELLMRSKTDINVTEDILKNIPATALVSRSTADNHTLINIKSPEGFSTQFTDGLKNKPAFEDFVIIDPILPVVSGNETDLPFNNPDSLLQYAQSENKDLGDIGLIYERCRSGMPEEALWKKMQELTGTIEKSIQTGMAGTTYHDRILHRQSHLIGQAAQAGKIPGDTLTNNLIAYVTAIMESKSALEVIVANPTAGSCGTVGGALKAVAEAQQSTPEELVKAYFAAGIIGVYFAKGPGFSAEEHGCQVECGAASGMAAAGIAQLMGGTAKQALDAASMAIQNMIGLVCDPVADRVEVPCLGKNISAAMNALSSATMACAGFDAVIPVEEVIATVTQVGHLMPACVKCTGKGGLAVTETAKKLKEQMEGLGI